MSHFFLKTISFLSMLFVVACLSNNKKANTAFDLASSPIRIVVIEDFSLSNKKETKVKSAALFALADTVAKYGGSLAYGTITAHSFEPLTELNIDEPPRSPVESEEKNPFKKGTKTQQAAQNESYKALLDKRRIENDSKIAGFLNAFEARQRKTDPAKYSDVAGALEKANQSLCAPNSFKNAPKTYIIVVSDLIHEWIGGGRKRFTGFSCATSSPMLVIGARESGNLELKKETYLNVSSFTEAARFVNVVR